MYIYIYICIHLYGHGQTKTITKNGHRPYDGGGVRPHAGFSKLQNKYKEKKKFKTLYDFSLSCRGGTPCTPDLTLC